jgi:hypothetical protein
MNTGYKFIYPSFPNRGLIHLLEMFPRIVERYPLSHLDIFCNFENEWLLKNHSESTSKILVFLEEQKKHVTNHGWVNGEILTTFWKEADIWFYPCVFKETCCLTAYEAAASNTLVVSNNLAALEESIGDRGIIVNGDPSTREIQDSFINSLFESLENKGYIRYCIRRNNEWIQSKTFDTIVSDFSTKYL